MNGANIKGGALDSRGFVIPIEGVDVVEENRKLNEVKDYQDKLKQHVAAQAAHIILNSTDLTQFNPIDVGREIIKISDPKTDAIFSMIEDEGKTLPGIKRAELEKLGLAQVKNYIENVGVPNKEQALEVVKSFEKDFDERNFEYTAATVREKLAQYFYNKDRGGIVGIVGRPFFNEGDLKEAIADPTLGLSDAEKKVAINYVLPIESKIVGTNIARSGFLSSFTGAIEKSGLNMGNTLADVVGARTQGDQALDAISMDSERFGKVKDRNLWSKFYDGTGDLTGQVTAMALSGGAVRGVAGKLAGAALAEKAGLFIGSYLNAYDGYKQQSILEMPEASEAARVAYASSLSFLEGATEGIFNDTKILNAFTTSLKPTVKELTQKVINGELTTELAKGQLQNSLRGTLKQFGKEYTVATLENASEEAIMDVANGLSLSIFGGQDFDVVKTGKQALETFATTALYSPIVAGLAAKGTVSQNNAQKSLMKAAIVDMAKNPASYLKAVEDLQIENSINQQEANEKIALINGASSYLKDIPADSNFDYPTTTSYLVHRLNEGIVTTKLDAEKKKANPDAVVISNLEKELARSQEVRKGIYDGSVQVDEDLNDVTTDEKKAEDLGISVIAPNEINRPETTTIAPDETLTTDTQQSTASVILPQNNAAPNIVTNEAEAQTEVIPQEGTTETSTNIISEPIKSGETGSGSEVISVASEESKPATGEVVSNTEGTGQEEVGDIKNNQETGYAAIDRIEQKIYDDREEGRNIAIKKDQEEFAPIQTRIDAIENELAQIGSKFGAKNNYDIAAKAIQSGDTEVAMLVVGKIKELDDLYKSRVGKNMKDYDEETKKIIDNETGRIKQSISQESDRISKAISDLSIEMGATENDLRWGDREIDEELGDRIGDNKSAIFIKPHESSIETNTGRETIEDGLTIELVTVNPKNRGEGLAKKRLQEITAVADKHSLPLFLDAVPQDKGVTEQGLKKLYEQFGFVFNGISGKRQPKELIQENEVVESAVSKNEEIINTSTQTVDEVNISKTNNDAVQEQGTAKMDVRQQTENGETVGEGNQVNKEPTQESTEKKVVQSKLRDIADRIEKEGFLPTWAKANLPEGTQKAGFNFDKAVADALRLIDSAIEAGKDVATAIEEGFETIRKHFADNNAKFKDEEKFKKDFTKFVTDNVPLPDVLDNSTPEELADKIKADEINYDEAIEGKSKDFIDKLNAALFGSKKFNLNEDGFKSSVRKQKDYGLTKADIIEGFEAVKKLTKRQRELIEEVFGETADTDKAAAELQEAFRQLAKGEKPKSVLKRLSVSDVTNLVRALGDALLSYKAISNVQLSAMADYIVDSIDLNKSDAYLNAMIGNSLVDVKQLVRAKMIISLQGKNDELATQLVKDMADDATSFGRATQSLVEAYRLLNAKGSPKVRTEFARKYAESVQQAAIKKTQHMADVISEQRAEIGRLNERIHNATQQNSAMSKIKELIGKICNTRSKK